MKLFATLAATITALAGIASAQVTYNSTTGTFSCPIANGAYCASLSLGGPIIIRCTNGTGQPGNCDDNLAGYFPYGVNYSPCWETSDKSGDAACSKNCIVQGSSGNFNGTFTLPNCTPIPSPSATSTPTTPVATPSSGLSTVILSPSSAAETGGSGSGSGSNSKGGSGGSGSSGVHNGTTSGLGSGGSATATPVGPSKTATGTGAPEYTGAANALRTSGLAAIGAVLAWFL